MKIIVDGVTPEDLDYVADNLDPKARAVYDRLGIDPREALTQALRFSRIRALVKVEDNGEMEVLGLFGWWDIGYLWFTPTPALYENWRALVRLGRQVVQSLVTMKGGIHIYIDSSNPKDIRLAEWLGFRPVESFEFDNGLAFTTYARST